MKFNNNFYVFVEAARLFNSSYTETDRLKITGEVMKSFSKNIRLGVRKKSKGSFLGLIQFFTKFSKNCLNLYRRSLTLYPHVPPPCVNQCVSFFLQPAVDRNTFYSKKLFFSRLNTKIETRIENKTKTL